MRGSPWERPVNNVRPRKRTGLEWSAEELPLGALLLALEGRLRRRYRIAGGVTLLPPPRSMVLMVIAQHPGHNQREYARTLAIDEATFGRYVEDMVQNGWIVRGEDARDRRRTLLHMTDAGATLAQSLAGGAQDVDNGFDDGLGAGSLEDLKILLARFIVSADR